MRRAIPLDTPISLMIRYTTPEYLEQFLVGRCGLKKEKINIQPKGESRSVVVDCALLVEHDDPARYLPQSFYVGCGNIVLFHPEGRCIEVMSYLDFQKLYVMI